MAILQTYCLVSLLALLYFGGDTEEAEGEKSNKKNNSFFALSDNYLKLFIGFRKSTIKAKTMGKITHKILQYKRSKSRRLFYRPYDTELFKVIICNHYLFVIIAINWMND